MGDLDVSKVKALVFGSSGFLGGEICRTFSDAGASLDTPARDELPDLKQKFEAIVFAQGVNFSGSIETTTREALLSSYQANTVFIVERLQDLLVHRSFAEGCSVVIVSSIWQEFARKGKLPYVASKSALGGVVRALSAELEGVARVNAVLPGGIDSPMARLALTSDQIQKIQRQTPIARLVTPGEVASLVLYLCSDASSGVNGQSVVIDGGWTSTIEV
jgi:NAD(P)-dependent dehydrogenase (short-subunit alcohol dehydrogenase family)